MPESILSISLKCYEPKTYGSKYDVQRKEELRDLILSKINNISEVQKKCKGKRLSIDVCFNLYSEGIEGRKTKDLDNMLKIFCDVFPHYVDRDKTVRGLGLLEDDRDDLIFEINCEKRLVGFESEEGIDFSIYEYPKL